MQELDRAAAIQLPFTAPAFITGPCKPQGLPSHLLERHVVAVSAMIPSLPLLPSMAGLLGPKDLYLCFRGLRRRSLLLW